MRLIIHSHQLIVFLFATNLATDILRKEVVCDCWVFIIANACFLIVFCTDSTLCLLIGAPGNH